MKISQKYTVLYTELVVKKKLSVQTSNACVECVSSIMDSIENKIRMFTWLKVLKKIFQI